MAGQKKQGGGKQGGQQGQRNRDIQIGKNLGDLDQVDENRNLTGSTTWETLPDQNPAPDETT
ncbi:MAG TPA: hypothetical protein VFS40_00435 [Gemmatimonadales bacterium]|nr:hypothetical protein [Gemmatimonadales bacterium]